MTYALAAQVITQRLMKLQTKGTPGHVPAWVHLKRRKRNKKGQIYWEVVHAKGHLDEVQALSKQVGMCVWYHETLGFDRVGPWQRTEVAAQEGCFPRCILFRGKFQDFLPFSVASSAGTVACFTFAWPVTCASYRPCKIG
jgi:hypothetical protein